jgi:hypothetical protein
VEALTADVQQPTLGGISDQGDALSALDAALGERACHEEHVVEVIARPGHQHGRWQDATSACEQAEPSGATSARECLRRRRASATIEAGHLAEDRQRRESLSFLSRPDRIGEQLEDQRDPDGDECTSEQGRCQRDRRAGLVRRVDRRRRPGQQRDARGLHELADPDRFEEL